MAHTREQGITLGALSIVLIAMSIVLILALIQIYISNRIYFESRTIHKLEQEVATLQEENTLLHMRIEKLLYKNRISDTIFALDDNEPQADNTPTEE